MSILYYITARGLEHYCVKYFGTIVYIIPGNVLTDFQLKRLQRTLILKWVKLGFHKYRLPLIGAYR